METEAHSILAASQRLGNNLTQAVDIVLASKGKLIVSGIGKSGLVGRKLAATFQSTGSPAVFLHASEAAHGDLGICQRGDVAILISKSGGTRELLELIPPLKAIAAPLIGILGTTVSPLGAAMDVLFDASVQREADPNGFTPTASSAVALALGHALAIALMEARGFTKENFLHLHAGGALGRNLRARVNEAMHSESEVAWVHESATLKEVVIELSRHPLGAACVIAKDGGLLGIVTDGDVRRALEQHEDIRTLKAAEVMTKSPTTVAPDALIHDALSLMEDRPRQISVLPVIDPSTGRCLGLIRLHDIYHTSAGVD
jgi:arabinose-5-phosphate isomerase